MLTHCKALGTASGACPRLVAVPFASQHSAPPASGVSCWPQPCPEAPGHSWYRSPRGSTAEPQEQVPEETQQPRGWPRAGVGGRAHPVPGEHRDRRGAVTALGLTLPNLTSHGLCAEAAPVRPGVTTHFCHACKMLLPQIAKTNLILI